MAATLAAGGKNPVTGKHVLDAANVPSVLAVMSTAGLYDDSGKWLYHTGLPAKSGVGGGIIAVSPGKFGIAVVSPPLDDAGNSVRAQRAIADISGCARRQSVRARRQRSRPRRRRRASRSTGSRCSTSATTSSKSTPNWFDTLRLTKLPKFANEFGEDNNTFAGVRQSRLGVRSSTPTALGELKTIFEFELFGTGVDSGQTTFRLRHAWGELGKLGAGQYWSPFTDPDAFPNSLEYWGPTGLPWFRNVQLRYTAIQTEKSNLMVALDAPRRQRRSGGVRRPYRAQGIRARFPLPDFAAAYKYTGNGATSAPPECCGGSTGTTLSTTRSTCRETPPAGDGTSARTSSPARTTSLRMQFTVGEGIQNEMNDSPVDIGIENNLVEPGDADRRQAYPDRRHQPFLDHTWNEKFSSAVGYSWQDNDNTDAQAPDAFKAGHYALGNVLYYPAPNVMVGGELQWGRRENFSDGFSSDGFKVQFSFKYNFSWKLGG